MFMQWRSIRWEKSTRYYEAYLHQDLWGDWVLTRVWGRRGSKLGQIRNFPCASYEEGLAQLSEVEKRRKQHGYRIV